MESKKFPNQWALITLWMKTHFAGESAVVFHNPGDYIEEVKKYITVEDDLSVFLVMSEIAILPTSRDHACAICNLVPDSLGYVSVWDGKSFVHENT